MPWILAAAAAIALTVAGGVWITDRWNADGDHAAPMTSDDATATPTFDADPTGCLGGGSRDAAMVLAAQDQAPHTSNGAVEVAAAVLRWMHQYPVPSVDDIDQFEQQLVASSSPYDLASAYADDPNTSGSLVPDGTPFHLSTVPGVWHLESYSDVDAVVTVGAGLVIDGELHPTFRMAKTFTLTWADDGWQFDEASLDRTTEELFAIGTPFTGGC
ncbi:hypothetical protein [Agromyces bracchium]|uniref:Uncharacterized protein n=1 Tax=Agromyces bracchium TaxID=88376 RepID=A0A6I3M7I3_9MICO|nr:hypothetical protein [Agromyces bracchium]MTH69459.1 hypothetical protein [Agromyces bracchium]